MALCHSARSAKGFLTGAIDAKTESAANDFRNVVPRFSADNRAANQTLIERLDAIAAARGATKAQIALAWLLYQRPWIVPIPRTTKLHRLEENIAAAAVEFNGEDLADINRALSSVAVQGERYPSAIESRVDR